MKTLTLFQDYSRREVHAIFSPHTAFFPQAGTWGLHGIVPVPKRAGDFVFFVTFGQEQGDHVFDEGITEAGVLTWQSQPKQSLDTQQIQQFIQHDELKNSIYLFLRTQKRRDYTYLGLLKYLSHDVERENPVHFQWQLLSPLPIEVAKRIEFKLQTSESAVAFPTQAKQTGLHLTPPAAHQPSGKKTSLFRARKTADYSAIDAQNRALGLAGEVLVLEEERKFLMAQGRTGLADKVRHVSVIEGDGAGYDILSFELDGTEKFIEVKTTRGPAASSFFMSANEVEFSRQHEGQYFLYRVSEFDLTAKSGNVFIIRGNVEKSFNLTPTQYRVNR